MVEILVIEDNNEVAGVICARLRDKGYNTSVATTGKQALEMILNHHWDIVLLDYSLPDMDGRALIESVKEAGQQMPPFIVSTGRGDERLAVEMMKMGAFDYLVKDPNMINRLPDVIEKLLNDKRLEKQLKDTISALTASEERFRSLVENSSDLFFQVDKYGQFRYISPNVKTLLGFEVEDFEGRNFSDFVIPEELPKIESLFNQALLSQEQIALTEYRIKQKKGNIRYYAVKTYGIFTETDICFNCIARDITEKHLALEQIARTVFVTEEIQKKLLAEKLNEDIGPLVSTIKMFMGRIRSLESNKPEDFKIINSMDHLVDDAVKKVRALANELMPQLLLDFGLQKALVSFLQKKAEKHNLNINTKFSSEFSKLYGQNGVIFYRAVSVLIESSIKDDSVDEIWIKARILGENIELEYQDNRNEFDQKAFKEDLKNNALIINHFNKIEAIGGDISYATRKRQRLSINISIPNTFLAENLSAPVILSYA